VLRAVVLTQYRRVTDRLTDRQTYGIAVASTALAMRALRRVVKKEIQLHLTRTRHWLSNEPSTKVDAAPNFLKMGIKYLNLSSFWTILTIKDEQSAEKFHYIKTLSGIVVAQSIAFRVVSIYWLGVAPSP